MAESVRADAQRNRQRILDVAADLFASEGLSVSVHEVARRAGVGTGTVSRHFPAKEDLFEAILGQMVQDSIDLADRLIARDDPGASFFEFFDVMIRTGSADRGFTERLAAAASDRSSVGHSAQTLCDRLEALLSGAQEVGAVRSDLSLPDVEALMGACMNRPDSYTAITDAVRNGLASPPTTL